MLCPDIKALRYDLDARERLAEAEGLAMAIGLVIGHSAVLPVRKTQPNTLFGSGQVQNIAVWGEQFEAELVIVDGTLTPIQQRNLEDNLKRKVIDRTGLILEIFGERAVTSEGRLQVELAHLDYQQSRLVRSWTHLERQRGGFGFLGGPGETQIEADRRMIRQRMGRLRRELEQVRKTRTLHRERRGRAPWPVIALVGYTNAGKSTLFNRLTGAEVKAEDLLFATLDPTMRGVTLPSRRKIILSDTVGFISDLPTQLVAAFRATLEEVIEADVLLHVRDISHPDTEAQKKDVNAVLTELGVALEAQESMIEVWNKVDLLSEEDRTMLAGRSTAAKQSAVSAITGEGIDALLDRIDRALSRNFVDAMLSLDATDGAGLAWAYANGDVIRRQDAEDGSVSLELSLPMRAMPGFERRFGERLARKSG